MGFFNWCTWEIPLDDGLVVVAVRECERILYPNSSIATIQPSLLLVSEAAGLGLDTAATVCLLPEQDFD